VSKQYVAELVQECAVLRAQKAEQQRRVALIAQHQDKNDNKEAKEGNDALDQMKKGD